MARSPRPSILVDTLVFAGGAAVAVLIFWTFYSFISPEPTTTSPSTNIPLPSYHPSLFWRNPTTAAGDSSKTFYDDPSLSFTLDTKVKDWDEKRQGWLKSYTSFLPGTNERILMLSGSQPGPCRNPVGDHLLLRFYKNKADYCRLHGIDFFYNDALLHPAMFSFWAKMPVVRAAMIAHPEAEWIWWVDSDAAITDMEFVLPLQRYADYNLIVHGWPNLVYQNKSWTSLNAGVFLMRNSQWSLDFINEWARMGPQSPEYDQWGKILKSKCKDKLFPESDDQTGLVYLLLEEKNKWGKKIYLENEYYFQGYWLEIVGRLNNISERYLQIEKRSPELRRRRAEKVAAQELGKLREKYLVEENAGNGKFGWRRPFITHFTGCQPCSGKHNSEYSDKSCYEGTIKALDFADDQVLRMYGFKHRRYSSGNNFTDVEPVPFDFPAGDGQ